MKKIKKMEVNTEDLVEYLFEICPMDKDCGIEKIEKQFNCKISVEIEKIHVLQHTFYYAVDFGLKEKFFVEIADGIDTVEEIISKEWGYDTKEKTITVEILKDILLDMDFYEEGSFLAKKAEAVLNANKSKLFEWHRQNNYDNYVTGGNSKMEMDSLLSQLKVVYIYEEKEVYRNFI